MSLSSQVAEHYQQLVDLPQAQWLCSYLGLPKLVDYWPAMLGLAVAFQLLRLSSNTMSSIVFGKKFDSLTARQQYDWGIRVVSQVHAIVVVIMSIPIFFNKVLLEDTLYGFDHYPACVYTIVCG
ncbi:hypothetical protein DL89DRAFT_253699 [Linderina pennispora]|uniref:Uncharacterized protein n=1 Tax=Linderina pennispora TaxID=61395 RepID=A0A1Y1WK69_9FUNG